MSSSSLDSEGKGTPKERQSSEVTNVTELSVDLRNVPRRPLVGGYGLNRIGDSRRGLPRAAQAVTRPRAPQVVKAKPTVDSLEETRLTPPGDFYAEYVNLKTEEPQEEQKKKYKVHPFRHFNLVPRSLAKVADTVLSQGFSSPPRTPVTRARSLSVLETVASNPEEAPEVGLDRRSAHPKPSEYPPENPLEQPLERPPEEPPEPPAESSEKPIEKPPEQPPAKPAEEELVPPKASVPVKPRYTFVVQLGDGAHGEVWLCRDPSGAFYAVKTLKPAKLYDRYKKARYALEKKVLHICRDDPECPESIVKFYETFYHKGWPFDKEHSPRLCHAMECCKGQTLYHRLRGEKRLNGKVYYDKKTWDGEFVRSICTQILKGLEFLHNKKIVHVDMKPENIMFMNQDENDSTIKIIDFGLSLELKEDREIIREIGGTPMYQPPEIFLRQRLVSFKMDIWAFGIILWEMLHGINRFPICPMSYKRALEKTNRDKDKALKLEWEHNVAESRKQLRFVTAEWKSMPDAIPLAEGVLRKDCASRFSAEEALKFVQNPWETKTMIRAKL